MNFDLYKKKTIAVFVLSLFLFSFSCKEGKKDIAKEEVIEQEVSNEPFFKLSLAQWSLHREIETGELNPFDFPKVAKELGFDAVEWVDQLYAKEIDSMGFDAVIERWKEESEKHGVKNVLIMVDRAGDLSHFDAQKRNEAVEKHKKYVDAAAYLGCHAIRVNTFGSFDSDQWVEATIDGLKTLSEYAATKNISVLAENHGWYSSDPRLLIPVIEKINMANCGTLADFGNWCIKRTKNENWGDCAEEYPDKYEGFERLMTKAQAVSAKAYEFDDKGNETTLDFEKFIKLISNSGYKGYISVEYENETLNEKEGILATKALLLRAAKGLN
ncbi:sugar phosphate isomerase/epimerase [Sabulilitoribacter multivorans]|uniref:Sugar phosphate isomerase/epimerase n=1 Tax=Flaviramulus multivorans TaxID=1304750 RepID=A0ABS9IFH1_9FLAO|nr:sugar phosphate isomerase/epimerase family protein [Flaviramulus multivorans]MCF7559145.1 sugar phosphate isomerase/epimerase [Flaviramulus multivorans]